MYVPAVGINSLNSVDVKFTDPAPVLLNERAGIRKLFAGAVADTVLSVVPENSNLSIIVVALLVDVKLPSSNNFEAPGQLIVIAVVCIVRNLTALSVFNVNVVPPTIPKKIELFVLLNPDNVAVPLKLCVETALN